MISILASVLRFIFRTVVLIGFLVFMLFPTLMLLNHYRRLETETGARKADAVSIRLANRLAWLFGVRVRVTGTPAEGPVLIAANHISWLDIPVLHCACAMGFVGKAEIDDWPVFSYIARSGGTIFHQRGCHDSAAEVISAMVQRLEKGRNVAIFPEGGIKPGSSVRVFHARMFRPAVDIGCPVQPVMIRYMSDGHRDDDFSFRTGESMLANIGRVLARRGVVADVHYLPTIEATGKPRRLLAESARDAVVASYEA